MSTGDSQVLNKHPKLENTKYSFYGRWTFSLSVLDFEYDQNDSDLDNNNDDKKTNSNGEDGSSMLVPLQVQVVHDKQTGIISSNVFKIERLKEGNSLILHYLFLPSFLC